MNERKAIELVFWIFAGMALVILVTSCSPYAAMSKNLDTATPSPSATATTFEKIQKSPTPRPITCTVTGYLNFRAGPTRSAEVIRVLEAGERVTVIERGAWLKVQAHGRTGFVYKGYCE